MQPDVSQAMPKSRSRGLILIALMCAMGLAAIDTTIVSTAIPQIVGDLGGFRLFSWVFSIYLLAQTVTIPIYGKLSDLYGRKPILLGGMLVFLAASVACAAAWNMLALIVFRAIQGLGAGALVATVSTLAGDLYNIRERAAVQGWLSSVWGMAAIIGPLLGGTFAEYVSWRWIFLFNLPVGAVAIALIAIFLHEDFERRRRHIDYAGAMLVLGAVGAAALGLMQGGQAWPWLSWQSGTLLALTILLTIATIIAESRAEEPIMPGWLWRDPVQVGSNLAVIGMGLVMMAPEAYLPTSLQSVQGLGAIAAGFVLASMSIGWPVASACSGRLYLRIGFRDTALIGGVFILVASVGFLLLPRPEPVWAVTLDQVILGAGFGLVSTPLLIGVQSVVEWERRGVVTGANMFARYLGQSLGAALFGAVFNAAIARHIADAPAVIASEMPASVNDTIATLHSSAVSDEAHAYLQEAISLATRDQFIGMALFAVLIIAVLFIAPRRFPILARGDEGDA